MSTQSLSPADQLAADKWQGITGVVHKRFPPKLQGPMLAFAEHVWLLAFDAGHARGVDAIRLDKTIREPGDTVQYLKDALVNAQHAITCTRNAGALPADLARSMADMLTSLSTVASSFPSGLPFVAAIATSVDHAMAADSQPLQLVAANDDGANSTETP
ncbi:hypothetical protein J7E62_25640 [Variovorax paradoxus]|nr:hypothetical protein [Variovorax paradoxus]